MKKPTITRPTADPQSSGCRAKTCQTAHFLALACKMLRLTERVCIVSSFDPIRQFDAARAA